MFPEIAFQAIPVEAGDVGEQRTENRDTAVIGGWQEWNADSS